MEKEKAVILMDVNNQMVELKCQVNALAGICEGMVNGANDASVFMDGLEWTVGMVEKEVRELDRTLDKLAQFPDASPET